MKQRLMGKVKARPNSGRGGRGMKYMLFGKVVMAMLGVLAVAVFAGGTVFAAPAEAIVDESASLRLASTGHVRPQLKAFARLQLLDNQQGGRSLRAAAQVESDGLTENRLYDLWLITPEGKSVLVDTGRADQEFDESDAGDSEIIVDLRGRLLSAPSDLTTLEGVTISIREHSRLGLFADPAPVLATGTVGASDLS